MATVGAAVPSAPFPLERFMVATIRLVGLLIALWALVRIATSVIMLFAFMAAASNAFGGSDSSMPTSFGFSSTSLVASGPGSGLVMLVGGVVVFAMAKRLARFVTKDL